MVRIPTYALCCALALSAAAPVAAQPQQAIPQPAFALPSYAVLVTQVLESPLVIDAQIRSTQRIKPADAPDLAPGHARFYVEADVLALIRGDTALPARIGYLADVPLDSRGKAPKLKKLRVLLFARTISGRPGLLQLTGIAGQRPWNPDLDALVRRVVRDALASDAAPAITRVGNAFHVPGTLPGEGETQIFLETASGEPISLQILRRPGQQPRWSVSLGDIIDESAGAPARDTLLWYRLACGLPRELPAASLEAESPANARIAREDYRLVLTELGPCA